MSRSCLELVLGSGSFIACGAVLPGKHYPSQSYLSGIPAGPLMTTANLNRMHKSDQLQPEIVIRVPASGHWQLAAKHLMSVLGLPQVAIMEEKELLPASVHTLILFDDIDFSRIPVDISVWRFADLSSIFFNTEQKEVKVKLPYCHPCNHGSFLNDVLLPTKLTTKWVPLPKRDSNEPTQVLRNTAFWLKERLFKGGGALNLQEFLEWCCAIRFLNFEPGRSDRALENLLEQLWKRSPEGFLLKSPDEIKTLSESSALLRGWVDTLMKNSSAATKPSKKIFLETPALAVWLAMEWQGSPKLEQLRINIKDLSGLVITTRQMMTVFLAAKICQMPEIAKAKEEKLLSIDFWPEHGSFPYSVASGKSLCLSPLILAFQVVCCQAELRLEEGIFDEVELDIPINWLLFEDSSLINTTEKLLSPSLVDNWLLLHTAPQKKGHHFKLASNNYIQAIRQLELVWLSLFDHIQSLKRRHLVRLIPWPAPFTAALSIRYDVDRPVSAGRVTELVRFQARELNAPCASWYFLGDDKYETTLTPILERHWQERGRHHSNDSEHSSGIGITHHSSPMSDYWKGMQTVGSLFQQNADYGEFLSSAINTPRPAWIDFEDQRQCAEMYFTPLHFPLEGSTLDKELVYFDQLLDQFRERLACGGHAIIGSHPDLDLSLLKQLLGREDFTTIWKANVKMVTDRCRLVMTYGSVWFAGDCNGDEFYLASENHIADLQVETRMDGSTKACQTIQLLPGLPRKLSWQGSPTIGPSRSSLAEASPLLDKISKIVRKLSISK